MEGLFALLTCEVGSGLLWGCNKIGWVKRRILKVKSKSRITVRPAYPGQKRMDKSLFKKVVYSGSEIENRG